MRLNAGMVRDAYSLPTLHGTLDCLNWVKVFTAVDLKLEYWDDEHNEASKPLTAFTVASLSFYKYKRIPSGLANAP